MAARAEPDPHPLQACVAGMFEYKEFSAFKLHARDFLVQTKQFADKDNADLFSEELEKQRQVGEMNVWVPKIQSILFPCS